MSTIFLVLMCAFTRVIISQQLPDGSLGTAWPNLSPECQKAVNTTISCPNLLAEISQTYVVGTRIPYNKESSRTKFLRCLVILDLTWINSSICVPGLVSIV
jgi:hypothetical protein